MMRYLIVVILQLLFSVPCWADLVVIVHPASGMKNLTRQQVIDIYLGRIQTNMDGKKIVPYDQPQDSEIGAVFYQQLTGRAVTSVNTYWARLLFTGRASPPRQPSDNMSVINIVARNLDAIGYIDERDLDDRVSVVFKIAIDE